VKLDVTKLPPMLQLREVGDHRYEGKPEHEPDADIARNVVFGGQILAQMIVAAHVDRNQGRDDDKEVKSIHAIFARAGDYTGPIVYEVERMHEGRTLGSDTVTFSQDGRIMSRGIILWSRDEPDLIRHTALVEMPHVAGPDDPRHRSESLVFPGASARVVDGINVWSPDQPVREPVLHIWTRYDKDLPMVANQAVLSWATDGWLIGTAMLPHARIDQSQAHRTISTGVISHTLNFHDRFRGDEWLLLANESIWAGRGRTHGRCTVWTTDGRLVATYTQDNLVRSFGDAKDHTGDYQRIM
jgi:acyl-CoA thioesterase II